MNVNFDKVLCHLNYESAHKLKPFAIRTHIALFLQFSFFLSNHCWLDCVVVVVVNPLLIFYYVNDLENIKLL